MNKFMIKFMIKFMNKFMIFQILVDQKKSKKIRKKS